MAARLGIKTDEIVRVAVDLVDDGKELSFYEVADLVGCRPPSLYHHFEGGVDDLRAAVIEMAENQMFSFVKSGIGANPTAMRVIEEADAWASAHPWLYRMCRKKILLSPTAGLLAETDDVSRAWLGLLHMLDSPHLSETARAIKENG